MSSAPEIPSAQLSRQWLLPPAATLGSSVRARGILLEVRAKLSGSSKKAVTLEAATLVLRLPEAAHEQFRSVSAIIDKTLAGIDAMPVIPREIEDILAISTTERHRWLKDGRLPSAGTRTVKLRGRARKITFHIFDPRRVEDILDRDLVDTWREDDALTAAENRRRAVWKAKLTRAAKSGKPTSGNGPDLAGWEEFERSGLPFAPDS
ncbi:hypothetical protein DMC47_07075 [Nostoc sp. 3335mG]|nr:hypothetical protein DMC47_07075 [Nostoc sp. 3335mG]